MNTIIDTNSLPINRFKAQLSKFSGIISKPFCKTTQRFFREMLYGIQASQDVKLSNIRRSLQEDIALIKTEDRLSRNLSKEDFFDHINTQIIRLADDKITDDMVISIGPGDIMKPYAKAMENLLGCGMAVKERRHRGIIYARLQRLILNTIK